MSGQNRDKKLKILANYVTENLSYIGKKRHINVTIP